jgi:hypothetical protein
MTDNDTLADNNIKHFGGGFALVNIRNSIDPEFLSQDLEEPIFVWTIIRFKDRELPPIEEDDDDGGDNEIIAIDKRRRGQGFGDSRWSEQLAWKH